MKNRIYKFQRDAEIISFWLKQLAISFFLGEINGRRKQHFPLGESEGTAVWGLAVYQG